MSKPIEFQLTDADGELHRYVLTTHRAREGSALVLRLVDLGGDALARVVEAVLSNQEVLAQLTEKGTDVELSALLEHFELRALMGDIRQALKSVDGAELLRELVRHCSRDGKALGVDQHFDDAYRANYGELFAAAWRSVQENRFLGFIDALVES